MPTVTLNSFLINKLQIYCPIILMYNICQIISQSTDDKYTTTPREDLLTF